MIFKKRKRYDSPYSIEENYTVHEYKYRLTAYLREKEIANFEVYVTEQRSTWSYHITQEDNFIWRETDKTFYSNTSALKDAKQKICEYLDEEYVQFVKKKDVSPFKKYNGSLPF